MKNNDIRALITRAGLHQYDVAACMGIKASTFRIYLTRPLTKPQKERIKAAIKTAKARNLNNGKKQKE
ncbi:MAG: hypothetical protein E7244_27765 [Enterocloster citroniae]|nr:hypothetical protein [Enterocloster citroniae]